MIIYVTKDGQLELRDANEFRSFKIAVEGADASPEFIAAALSGIATLESDGKTAWVSQLALKRWQGKPQPPEWVQRFDIMVATVRRFGWVKDEEGTVRAHIETGAA